MADIQTKLTLLRLKRQFLTNKMAPLPYDIVNHINDYLPRSGRLMSYNQIPGFFAFAQLYEKVVKEAKDGDTFLEVGSFLGKSTAFMANEIKKSGKKIKFYSIDPWDIKYYDNNDVKEALKKNMPQNAPFEGDYMAEVSRAIVELGLQYHVKLIQTSTKSLSYMLGENLCERERFDFIFIDASHEYKDVLHDIKTLYPLLKRGGTMAGDDFKSDGVRRAVEETFGNNYTLSEGYFWSSWIHQKTI